MDYGPHRHLFEDATPLEIGSLDGIIQLGKNRNWDWLIEWIDGHRGMIMGKTATAKEVIEHYSNDEKWDLYK